MNLPLIETSLFFILMFILLAFDGYSTAKGLRSKNAKETNGVLAKLIKYIGLNETLFIVKAGTLIYLWFNPSESAIEQWFLLALYVFVAINNIRVLRQIKNNQNG